MKLRRSIAEIITDGYLLVMAVFFLVAVPAVKLKWTLSKLAWIWILLAVILMLTAVGVYKEFRRTEKKSLNKMLVSVMLISIFVSLGFTRPYAEDATLEIVNTALATDSMYQYDEYTGDLDEYAVEGHAFSPIEMLYATFIKLTGMESTLVLYYIIPIFLIGVFYAGIWRLGSVMLKDDAQKTWFTIFVISIFWMTTYLEGQSVVTGIFLNSWNGLTWLSCFIMPMALANGLEFMNRAIEGKIEKKWYRIIMALVLILAAQLTNSKGGFYVLLMWCLVVIVVLVRKGYDYGVTSSRFKKCV